MLLQMGIADAFGIAFEFVKDAASHGLENTLRYQQNPRYPELKPSQYTDDTLRSIATWRAISSRTSSDDRFNPATYALHILLEFRRDQRKGWSKGFQALLEQKVKDAGPVWGMDVALDFMRAIRTRKASNGSVMGCLPCGLLPDTVDVKIAASAQAIATHSAATIPYAQAMALSAHYFTYDLGNASDLLRFLESEVDGYYEAFRNLPIDLKYLKPPFEAPDPMSAENAAYVVLLLLQNNNTLTEIMRAAVEFGGDTDSHAALAVGIASCSADYADDIPASLITGLDEGSAWGDEYLRDIDAEMKRFVLSAPKRD